MGLSGPGTAELRKLAASVTRVQRGELTKVLLRDLQEELKDLTDERFRSASAPDGSLWAPLVLRSGRPLRDTGHLAISFGILSKGGKHVGIGSALEYAEHTLGTGIYGPTGRRIYPTQAKALAFTVRGAKGAGNKRGKRAKKGFVFKSVAGSPPRLILPRDNTFPESYRQAFDEVAQERMRIWFFAK